MYYNIVLREAIILSVLFSFFWELEESISFNKSYCLKKKKRKKKSQFLLWRISCPICIWRTFDTDCVLEYERRIPQPKVFMEQEPGYPWWRHGIRNTRMLESRGQARSQRSWRVVGVSAQNNGHRDRIRPAILLLQRYFSLDRNLGYRDTVFMIVLISVTVALRSTPSTLYDAKLWDLDFPRLFKTLPPFTTS